MAHVWNFSAELLPQVEMCQKAAVENETSMKWRTLLKKSHQQTTETVDLTIDDIVVPGSNDIEEVQELNITKLTERIEKLETESIQLEDLNLECFKNPDLISILAQKLSTGAINRIFQQLYEYLDYNFLEKFFIYFFPVYLKRDQTLFSIDLLVKACKINEQIFNNLILLIIKDREISNSILEEFIFRLNKIEKTKILILILEAQLSCENFKHHVESICYAYKDCEKDIKIQKLIYKYIGDNSLVCAADRNFGKLFLNFLQEQRSKKFEINMDNIKTLVEIHQSPMKRPCYNIMMKILEES